MDNSKIAQAQSGQAEVCILVVDDHPNTAATMARVITQLGPGIEVLSAENGEQAISLLMNRTVDLLLTDLVMPGVTGLELIERIQALTGSRPAYTILMTAYEIPGLKEIARHLLVNEVVRKPIPPETLCRMIARAFDICGFGPMVSMPVDGSADEAGPPASRDESSETQGKREQHD
jgi:CheY-like chemotaxis protein